jgi:hypothetical protein
MVGMSPGVQTRFLGAPPGCHAATSCATVLVNNNRRQNNRMNLTRSASETDSCGPCRLSVC